MCLCLIPPPLLHIHPGAHLTSEFIFPCFRIPDEVIDLVKEDITAKGGGRGGGRGRGGSNRGRGGGRGASGGRGGNQGGRGGGRGGGGGRGVYVIMEEEEVEVGEIAVAGTSANFLFSFDVFSFCFR